MKNIFLKTIGMTLAIMMLAFAQISVSAQEGALTTKQINEKTQENLSEEGGNAGKLVGTWDVQVTIRNCETGAALRTFSALATYMFGGTTIESNTAISPSQRTPGHGVWSFLGGNNYRFKRKNYNFDASGNFTGWTILRQDVHLNLRADEAESEGTAEIFAPNGVLVATLCSTATATRFE